MHLRVSVLSAVHSSLKVVTIFRVLVTNDVWYFRPPLSIHVLLLFHLLIHLLLIRELLLLNVMKLLELLVTVYPAHLNITFESIKFNLTLFFNNFNCVFCEFPCQSILFVP